MQIPEYKAQIGGGVILALFSCLLYFYIIPTQVIFASRQMGVSPRFFPDILALLLFIFSIALGIDGYKMRNREKQKVFSFVAKEVRLVFLTLLIIALQTVGFQTIGYLIPAILALAVCMFLYGQRSLIKIALVSILLPWGIKLFFEKTLQVYLP
ncbi:MAG: tripartite tricarboxylate transporter TctB family protein [Deltaproteobacteria bacterium]|nr:tripartite tricarboxylate transporter TctB family protein [Deltaproteobacteria bacterium]